MQPCWTCTKYLGGCPWSARFEPVPGWEAKPVKRRAMPHSAKEYVDTYDIKSCPMYENDGSLPPEERGRKPVKRKEPGNQKGTNQLSPEEERQRMDLYQRGMSDYEIERRLGIGKGTMHHWRERRKLPANRSAGRPRKEEEK